MIHSWMVSTASCATFSLQAFLIAAMAMMERRSTYRLKSHSQSPVYAKSLDFMVGEAQVSQLTNLLEPRTHAI
jgi:hypothetical protein